MSESGRTYRGESSIFVSKFIEATWEGGIKKMSDREQATFAVKNKVSLADGTIVWNYKCPCGVRARLERDLDGQTEFFVTSAHMNDCRAASPDELFKRGLNSVQKTVLQQLFDQNFNTVGKVEKRMIQLVQQGGLPDDFVIPPLKKIEAAWRSLRKTGADQALQNLNATPEMFQAYADGNRVEKGPDDMFVIGYHQKTEGQFVHFTMVWSTPRLLSYVPDTGTYSESMHADDTECTWQGFPLLMGGFSDAIRLFTPVVVAISSGKSAVDYSHMFADYKVRRPDHVLRICVADGAQAIFNGLVLAYPHIQLLRVMCWMHAFIKNFTNKALKRIGFADVVEDIVLTKHRRIWKRSCVNHTRILHQCTSLPMFNLACDLWKKKYVDDMPDTKIKEVIFTYF
jgi:hypothetical protein